MLFTRLVKIHQPIFLRSAQSIIETLNYKRWFLGPGREGGRTPSVISLCEMPVPLFVAWRERVLLGRTLSVAYGDSSPEGRALGKEGRFRPHSLTAGRSQLLSCKLPAPAKASPFRERWHGEAVTERVAFGTNPLSRLRRQLSRGGEPLAKRAGFVLTSQWQKKSADKR